MILGLPVSRRTDGLSQTAPHSQEWEWQSGNHATMLLTWLMTGNREIVVCAFSMCFFSVDLW